VLNQQLQGSLEIFELRDTRLSIHVLGDAWVHEVKFDGYRVQVHKMGSRVVIYSRNRHDFT
jgi:bifunctional non-homologous end joining protein LigD